jgi:hypothetical protein
MDFIVSGKDTNSLRINFTKTIFLIIVYQIEARNIVRQPVITTISIQRHFLGNNPQLTKLFRRRKSFAIIIK